MSREEITQTISLMGPEVKKCYEKLLEAFPEADGRITLKFTVVDSDGVGRVDLEDIDEDSSLNEKTLNECIIENLRNLEFPAPEGGDVQISYPFSFAAAKEGGP
jgi:hypothetical protein